MLSPLTQAQSVRARRNWARARDLYFGGKAGKSGADRQHEGGASASRRFNERQGYGVNNDLANRLAEGLGIKDDATTSASHANVAPRSDSESGVRFSVSRQKVQNYIWAIEEAAEKNEQMLSTTTANFDIQLMRDLIVLANRKRSDLNAHHAVGPEEFAKKVVELIDAGAKSFRLIVRDFQEGTHFMAFDVNNEGWRPSVIGIEPIAIGPNGENDLAPRCRVSLEEELPEAAFLVVETEIQTASGGCGMFSLFLVKTMLKMADEITTLHGNNILSTDQMADSSANEKLPLKRVAGDILSPRFMKHAQSKTRLMKYFSNNRGRMYEEVNKRGEVLGERYLRHWGEWTVFGGQKRSFSRSIEIKRIAEYQALLDAIDEENRSRS